MLLNDKQIADFKEYGFLLVKNCFDKQELQLIREAADNSLQDFNNPGLVMEEGQEAVRAVHGPHFNNELLSLLSRHASLLKPIMTLLNSEVYVQQYKINLKAAFVGDVWSWHQDFTFFHNEDHVPQPLLITAAIFIDKVTEFNGPLIVIPGSHAKGFVGSTKENYEEYDATNSWLSNTTAKLRYSVDKSIIADLVESNGLYSPVGEEGTVLFFHCNLFHCSSINMSPFDRRIAFITYNNVNNIPNNKYPRPEFLACTNYTPLKPCIESLAI